MKKLFISLLSTTAAMTIHAGNNPAERADSDAPVFVGTLQDNAVMVYYWTDLEEPEDGEYYRPGEFDICHKEWRAQENFRKNAAAYKNLFLADGTRATLKYRGEQIHNPDGNDLFTAEIHFRPEIPNCGAVFDVAAPAKEVTACRDGVVVSDEYLKSHKPLPLTDVGEPGGNTQPLPEAVVSSLERKYAMKANKSHLLGRIGARYVFGAVQFQGPCKDESGNNHCLALDVLIDGDTFYVNEQLGYYQSPDDFGWNVDDGGVYSVCPIIAAFEGNGGLTLCCCHYAPESLTTGIYTPADGRLVENFSAMYRLILDEEIPVWKSDLAEMERLFIANSPNNNPDIKFKLWSHIPVDYANEWIWAVDTDNLITGAIFLRKDGKLTLIAETGPNRVPSVATNEGKGYLMISGDAGDSAWHTEVYIFDDANLLQKFTSLEVNGSTRESSLNGKPVSKVEAHNFSFNLPRMEAATTAFNRID